MSRQHPNRPVIFVWSPEGYMIPLPRFRKLCDQIYAVHEEYPLVIVENRSMKSHNAYFAQIEEAWKNLPEDLSPKYPSSEHLRAWALVETGWCTEEQTIFDTEKDAKKFAVALRNSQRRTRGAPITIIRVHGNIVQEFTPMSQSTAAMKKIPFEQSKKDVLDYLLGLIGTTARDLRNNAGRSA